MNLSRGQNIFMPKNINSFVILMICILVWLATQNHSALVKDPTTVPFLPVNPSFSSTRNQVSTYWILNKLVWPF